MRRRTAQRAGGPLGLALGLALGLTTPALAATGPGPALPGPAGDCPDARGVMAPKATPWAQQALGFTSVWGLTRGAGVTVAVADSGVDTNPQFGTRFVEGLDLAPATVGVPAGADCVGHGTSVASIIAAAPVAGVSFAGVAPAARVLSIKITNSDSFPGSLAAQAIRAAVTAGAQVINLSLATTVSTPALAAAVRLAEASNVVVVAAAGNDSSSRGSGPFFPAAYPGVLSVGAVSPGGSLAAFSDTRTPVSVTAPGVGVTAAFPGVFPQAYNPASNGTSFATAFVSGVVALVRSAHPGLTQSQVVDRIEATADGGSGPGTGHGLVNPVQAVTAVLPAGGSGASSPAARSPGRVQIDRAPRPDHGAASIAVPLVAGAAGAAVLVVAAAVIVPAGRRRHWRPGPSRP
ncbi:MAG TPA: S8 family serine peptidase [Streptosporangiaceae bacterium]